MILPKSILLPEVQGGVVKVSGYRGTGKTSFLIRSENPALIAFLDFESKGKAFDNQLHFGLYTDLMEGTSGPLEVYSKTMKTIDNLEEDRYTVVILDDCSQLELALKAEAHRDIIRYCQEYGLNIKNARSGSFGGVNAVINFMIQSQICSALRGKGVQMIGITHHIGSKWGAGGPIPNKKRIKGSDRWMNLAVLSLIIVEHGDFPPVPSAMVEKEQLCSIEFNEETGEFDQRRRLPFRLPRCTWQSIKYYLDNPADLDSPGPGEALKKDEFDVFSERLNKEQIAVMKLALQKKLKEENSDMDLSDLLGVKPKKPDPILALAEAGKTAEEIAAELGMPLPVVRRVMEG